MTLQAKNGIFHVHTFRCHHAEMIEDAAYVQRAIGIGASDIWFTDHAPFPEDPFGGRMSITELPEYIETLKGVKKQYANQINVHIGLEIEYFPAFTAYYELLKTTRDIEVLVLGQHMYALPDGSYSFSLGAEEKNAQSYIGEGRAIIDGIESGYFDVVAHPDRIFKRCKTWTSAMDKIAKDIIGSAVKAKIPLEKNIESMRRKHNYWAEFWEIVPDNHPIIYGLDAHSVKDLNNDFIFLSQENHDVFSSVDELTGKE